MLSKSDEGYVWCTSDEGYVYGYVCPIQMKDMRGLIQTKCCLNQMKAMCGVHRMKAMCRVMYVLFR